MAKNFSKAGSMKAFENTKKIAEEKAQVITLLNVRNENLLDYPKNNEDISVTDDLELSMAQNGFTDPIEVTDFGMETGKYMIISGHRRRAAAVKVFGNEFVFPCLVRHFGSENEVQNYVLFANSQRDSAKDPLLFCKRYKMHEEYLNSIGFQGNKREEIAKRLGISIPQADRYNALNRVILEVWDMIRAEQVGMSSVQPMAKYSREEQYEIYGILQEALAKDVELTRGTVNNIVKEYAKGKRSWAEIADLPRDSGLPLFGSMNTEPGETKDPVEYDRNDEVRHDPDPIGAEYDKMDEDRRAWEEAQAEADVEDDEEDGQDEDSVKEEKQKMTREEKELKAGKNLLEHLGKVDSIIGEFYRCEDGDSAQTLMSTMVSIEVMLIDEVYRLAEKYDKMNIFDSFLATMEKSLNVYKE